MAQALDRFDFDAVHGNAVYPWAEWTDGQPWEIVEGVDFHVDPDVMRGQIIVRGRKDGKPTTRLIREDGKPVRIVFQFPARRKARAARTA